MRLATFITSVGAAVGLAAALAGSAFADDRPLRVVGPWEIVGVDPAQSGYVFSRTQVAETLVTADGEGRLAPLLAEGWSASGDGLTWRFPVRSGATFHDGTPVTAEAAAASLERARAGTGAFTQAPVASIAAEGREVVIRLERPFASLPAFLANYGTIILAPGSYDTAGAVTRIIGSGPYKVKALTPPLKLELERADGWWGGTPAVAAVSYLAVGQGETRALMAESGEADLVFSMLPVSVERLKRNPRLDVHVTTIPRTRQLKLNAGSPFFDDVRERRAVSLALDRAGIAKVILRNGDLAATQLFPPTLAGWHDEKLPPLERDLDAARKLLAEAGWTAGADGILEQDGHEIVSVPDGRLAVLEIAESGLRAADNPSGYDLVLMDMHMPEMDGPTATRTIRELAGPASSIPIVGLSADAMTDQMDRHMSAGLDAYLTKPIDHAKLRAIVARTRPSVPGGPVKMPEPAVELEPRREEPEPQHDRDLIDEAQIEEIRAGVGDEMLAELLSAFCDDVGKEFDRVRNASAAEDWAALAVSAHTLKGVASNLGAARIAGLAKSLELAAKDAANLNTVAPILELDSDLFGNLATAVDRTVRELSRRT